MNAIVSNPAREGDTGRITIGYYTIADGILTMTDGEGRPVRRQPSGELYKHKLEAGDDAVVIAKRLTLSIYRRNIGGGAEGFNRPLNYPVFGVA